MLETYDPHGRKAHMKIKFLLYFLIGLCSMNFARAQGNGLCRALLTPQHKLLTPELIEAIHNANQGSTNEVLVYSKNVNGIERLVVIAGEQHVKPAADAQLLTNLRSHFQFVANEGIDTSKYWFPKAYNRLLDYQTDDINTRRSAIIDSQIEAETLVLKSIIVEMLSISFKVKKITIKQIEAITAEEIKTKILKELVILEFNKFDEKFIAELINNIDFNEVKKQILIKMASLENTDPALQILSLEKKLFNEMNIESTRVNFELEEGHRPSFKQQIKVANDIFRSKLNKHFTKAAFISIAMSSVGFIDKNPTLILAGIGSMLTYVSAFALNTEVENHLKPHSQNLRDLHMTKNLEKILNENPQVDKILIQVGRGHLDNLGVHLIMNGYTDVTPVR